ncbi:hypothetical protein CBER1_04123 [Cercospora berteroae]|uniref:Uncharacterized protein n=1 Tax=Cercospora berteroae TaxID=357750 RepID=A0A2S6CGT8_9PEZI|nr:hypothetical protein CBER1_04123 [Cercospora berteroae]
MALVTVSKLFTLSLVGFAAAFPKPAGPDGSLSLIKRAEPNDCSKAGKYYNPGLDEQKVNIYVKTNSVRHGVGWKCWNDYFIVPGWVTENKKPWARIDSSERYGNVDWRITKDQSTCKTKTWEVGGSVSFAEVLKVLSVEASGRYSQAVQECGGDYTDCMSDWGADVTYEILSCDSPCSDTNKCGNTNGKKCPKAADMHLKSVDGSGSSSDTNQGTNTKPHGQTNPNGGSSADQTKPNPDSESSSQGTTGAPADQKKLTSSTPNSNIDPSSLGQDGTTQPTDNKDSSAATNADTSNNGTSNNDASNNDASNNDASNNDASNTDTSNTDTSNNDTSNNDTFDNDTSNIDTSNTDTSNTDNSNDDTSQTDTFNNDTSNTDTSNNDTDGGDSSSVSGETESAR